jgi:predicted nucleic acid-binding protein
MVKTLHDRIVKMMIEYDGKLNYHDCLISLMMKEKGLTDIVTLDKGFQVVPWIKVIG